MFRSKENLTQSDAPLVWKYAIKDSNLITLWVGYDGGEARNVDLDLSYCPALACFDIEYWQAMFIPVTIDNRLELLKVKLKQQRMQDLRRAISLDVITVDRRTLQDGSWKMARLHQWCTRTLDDFSHSEFGCNQYLIHCREKKKVPYAQELKNEGECFHVYSHWQPMCLKPGCRIRLDPTFYEER